MANRIRNATQINNILKDNLSNYSININTILYILNNVRFYIANYYKNVYMIKDISKENKHERFSIDENHFLTLSNEQIWVIGIIYNFNKGFRLEISSFRNEAILRKIITTNIKAGNFLITDGWSGYSFLSEPDSSYTHSLYNHSHGDFRIVLDSHIEQLWSQLKYIMKKIYIIIPKDNFLLFLRESYLG